MLKQNMYSLEDGEPSVFEREAKTTDAPALSHNMFVSRTQRAGRDYNHQDWCQVCADGGSLVLCDWCPCAYHLSCLGVEEVSNFNFSCPHHQCKTCGRKAGAVGGLLFRCEVCEAAFCEDDLPQIARDNITNTCPRFIELGQNHPRQACFMLCSKSCIEYHAATNGGRDPDAFLSTMPNVAPPVPTKASAAAEATKKPNRNCSKPQKKENKGVTPPKAARITDASAAATCGASQSKLAVSMPMACSIVPEPKSCWERLGWIGFPSKEGYIQMDNKKRQYTQFNEQRLKELISQYRNHLN